MRPQSALNEKSPQDPFRLLGETLQNRYYLEDLVGESLMSEVYRCRDLETGSIVAIKVLDPFGLEGKEADSFLRRFQLEMEAAKSLTDPRIVRVHEMVTEQWETESRRAFIRMEWLEGGTLRQELKREGRLTLARAASILEEVCLALDVAHYHKVIHNDIKPENIFLLDRVKDGVGVKIIDFGVARIMRSVRATKVTELGGTEAYMAPEFAMDHKVGPQSDVFSLGVSTYEMLTGKLPFDRIYAGQQPPSARLLNPDVPMLVDELLRESMSYLESDRPPSAGKFYTEFRRRITLSTERYIPEPYGVRISRASRLAVLRMGDVLNGDFIFSVVIPILGLILFGVAVLILLYLAVLLYSFQGS